MKILFDASVFKNELTGVAKSTKYLYEACHRVDADFTAYGFSDSDLSKYDSPAIKMLNFSAMTDAALYNWIRENRIEAVHYPNNGKAGKEFLYLKQAVTIHDVLPLQMPDGFGRVESENLVKRLGKRMMAAHRKWDYRKRLQRDIDTSDLIFTISDFSRKSIQTYFRVDKEITVIPWDSALPDLTDTEFCSKGRRSYILYFGGYDRRKGISHLVKAFTKLYQTSLADIDLLLAGKKYSLGPETDRLINEGVQAGRMIETGYLADNELAALIKNAVAVCYLSSFEGFGLPVIESMKLGCPVITTNRTSIPEVGGNAVLYVRPEDMDEVVNTIINLVSDSRLRENMIRLGMEQAKKFSWEKTADAFLTAIDRMPVKSR